MPVYSVSRRRAIALLALSSILLITLDIQGNSAVRGFRGIFGTIFQPVQSSARVITRPLENAWQGITDYGELESENARLQDQLDQQEGAFIAALATVRDAQELLALNGIDNLADTSSVTAQVIGGTPSNFSQTLEINQGSDRGLRVGMPVINAAGLVGRVTWVDNDRSLVLLANDSLYAIPVQVVNQPDLVPATTTTTSTTTTSTTTTSTTTTTSPSLAPASPLVTTVVDPNAATSSSSTSTSTPFVFSGIDFDALAPTTTGNIVTIAPGTTAGGPTTTINLDDLPVAETGIFRGRGIDNAPVVEFIDQNSRFGEVQVGALVITSGGSQSLAPRGIVVGRVIKIVERTGTSGAVLEVRLTAKLTALNFVRVLLYQPVATGIP
ncbi:MAG: rod shape-determining protein MreC [Actinomycetota bacterium]|nr:rod shape-determining protein MreC [Actinomycetota bacterium]MDA3018961.1 rod shape-determining protein MreC [Actinomycetota bacterium]